MATQTWKGGTGTWGVGSNWSGGSAPSSTDAAVFNSASNATVTSTEFEDATSLTMSASNETLNVQGELTIGDAHLNGVPNVISTGSGVLNVNGGGLIAGQFVTSASGTVHLSNGGTYEWMGSGSTQTVDMGKDLNDSFDFSTQFGGNITNFYSGDLITYNGTVNSVNIGSNVINFHATNGQTYSINLTGGTYNSSNLVVVGNSVESTATPCFVSGTRIRTSRGDVAVEALSVGDIVATFAGKRRPIRWLGHRTIDCRNHPHPEQVRPVRVSADAFGKNRPARDLYVSPGHAICVDVLGEVLIPANALVNGATIQQVEVEDVTYWHVELDSHDVMLAENLACESYLDMGNRGFFQEADVVDLAAEPDADPSRRTHADFCRPFYDTGPVVEAVGEQLHRRATDLGWTQTHDIDLHLEADGRRLDPVMWGLAARFHVPVGAKDVWLVSSTARPSDVLGTGDRRDLGLCFGALRVGDGFDVRDVAIDDPLLCIGFHDVEECVRRWTAGRARLPVALWERLASDFYLRVELAGVPVPRWTAPTVKAAPAERPLLAIIA